MVSGRDIAADAFATIRSQVGRSVGVGVAAALGIATLVGAVQLATSADAQVQARIDAVRPEVIRATPTSPAKLLDDDIGAATLETVTSLPTVRAASVVQRLMTPARVSVGNNTIDAPVSAVEGDLRTSAQLSIRGRSFRDGEIRSGAHVALVGHRVASSLHLSDVRLHPTIWINGTSYTVIGRIEDSELAPDLVDQVVLPRRTVETEMPPAIADGFETVLYVRAPKDDVAALARDLPLWLRPEAPEQWRVEVPRRSIDLATSISSDVRNLSLASGGLVLLIGAVGIGNAMLRSVYERIQELGLRRALGARSSHIVGLLLTEAAVIGLIAGALGVGVGYLIAIAVAALNGWPLALDPRLAIGGTALAIVAALIGAAMPSRVATRVSPAEALRRI